MILWNTTSGTFFFRIHNKIHRHVKHFWCGLLSTEVAWAWWMWWKSCHFCMCVDKQKLCFVDTDIPSLHFPPTQSLPLGYHTRDLVNLCQLRKHPPSQSGPGAGTLFYGLQAENGFYSFKMVKKENQRENNILWHMNIIWNSNSSVCKILMEQSHAYSFTCCLWLLLPRLQELQQRLYGLQSLKYLLSGLSQKVCLPLV